MASLISVSSENGHLAEFEGMPQQGGGGWSFWRDLDYFEEVPAPTAEVDWEKKYTELKRKAIAMLSATVMLPRASERNWRHCEHPRKSHCVSL